MNDIDNDNDITVNENMIDENVNVNVKVVNENITLNMNTFDEQTFENILDNNLEQIDNSSEITTFASHLIKIENTVPKILIPDSLAPPKYININDKAHLIFIDSSLLNLLNEKNISELNEKYKLFFVNETHLHSFITNILSTDSKFVYPLVFVNFIRNYLQTEDKISFDPHELLKLRVWANQLRNEHGFKNKQTYYNQRELYIGYVICCEMIYYSLHHPTVTPTVTPTTITDKN